MDVVGIDSLQCGLDWYFFSKKHCMIKTSGNFYALEHPIFLQVLHYFSFLWVILICFKHQLMEFDTSMAPLLYQVMGMMVEDELKRFWQFLNQHFLCSNEPTFNLYPGYKPCLVLTYSLSPALYYFWFSGFGLMDCSCCQFKFNGT